MSDSPRKSVAALAAALKDVLRFERAEGRRVMEAPLLRRRKAERRQRQAAGHRAAAAATSAAVASGSGGAAAAAPVGTPKKKERVRPEVPLSMCRAQRLPACEDPKPMPLLVIGEVGAFEGEQRAFLDKVLGAIGYVLEEKVEAIRPRYPEEDAPAAVLTLGHHATDYIVRGAHPFLMLLGKFHVRNDVPVMPVFDPGMMMSSEANRRRTWMDLKSLLKHLDLALPPK